MQEQQKLEPLLCCNCKFLSILDGLIEDCSSSKAEYTDFVNGKKDPHQINIAGGCLYYQSKEEGD